MNAQEARERTKNFAKKVNIGGVLDKIAKTCDRGESKMDLDRVGAGERAALEKLGYVVKFHSDPRNETWYEISW